MKPKNSGIMKAIICRWAGSIPGEGVMYCVKNMREDDQDRQNIQSGPARKDP